MQCKCLIVKKNYLLSRQMFVAPTHHTPSQTNDRNENPYFPAERKYHLTVKVWAGRTCKYCSILQWTDCRSFTSVVVQQVSPWTALYEFLQGKSANTLMINTNGMTDRYCFSACALQFVVFVERSNAKKFDQLSCACLQTCLAHFRPKQ